VVVHTCNPSAWEAEAEGSRFQEQPKIHSDKLTKKIKSKICEKSSVSLAIMEMPIRTIRDIIPSQLKWYFFINTVRMWRKRDCYTLLMGM
jgi:hypothetical protein